MRCVCEGLVRAGAVLDGVMFPLRWLAKRAVHATVADLLDDLLQHHLAALVDSVVGEFEAPL